MRYLRERMKSLCFAGVQNVHIQAVDLIDGQCLFCDLISKTNRFVAQLVRAIAHESHDKT